MKHQLIIGGLLVMTLSGTAGAGVKENSAQPRLIPREILFGNPVNTNPEISPDGKKLAYLAPVNNVLNVWVKTINGKDDAPVTRDTERGIRRFFWAADNAHILYLQDYGGNENWRLFRVDLKTCETLDLTPFDNVQVRIIEHNKDFPNDLIISMNKEDEKLHDVYHCDLTTAALAMVEKNPGNVVEWILDAQLNVRGALASLPDGGFDLLIREDKKSPWKKALTWNFEDSSSSSALGFTKDGRNMFLLDSRGVNASQLVKIDLMSFKRDILAFDPAYDVSGVMSNPDTYEIEAVSFTKERTEWLVLDKRIENDFNRIKLLHKGDFRVTSRNDADTLWVVGFTVDNGAVAFYLYDRLQKKGQFLFYHKPELENYTLASMEPIKFTSRDGLVIHGFITYPLGLAKKALPVVLNVHGGPWVRDTWGYDAEAQWFANRGYACFQVNYRGSSGYGKKFLNAGNKEWGGKMHDDLIDGVQWLIKKGIADPRRIAIFGASYGGYAALAGAAFTPDVFCCAVDIVGPSNLLTFIDSIPSYWKVLLADLHKRVGDPGIEHDFLVTRSPFFKAADIKIPLLIAQGANDPRVKKAESDQIVKALKEKGIAYEYMLFPDEGHGFAKPQNRLKFYAAAEKFLGKYLQGRFEEDPAH
jgi:dipeptidyl aminopeptidase/acylaminoacyl peptidase